MAKSPIVCQWLTLEQALAAFVQNVGGHQGSTHIKPLHWHVASRLVLEGGFRPEEITPRPPFVVEVRGNRYILHHDENAAGGGERTILGGLKTKDVDVVVAKDGIGPAIAISMKGSLNAFRNLTNRMEEAVGDCTNLHISYPALVYGFLHVIRANREAPGVSQNDVALCQDGSVADSIFRYHDVMARLTGRDDVRDAMTKYEAVALALVNADQPHEGQLISTFPPATSPLRYSRFFQTLYQQYDQRFVYAAPKLARMTRRLEWDAESPALAEARANDIDARVLHAD